MRYYLEFADLLAQDGLNQSAMTQNSNHTSVDKMNCPFRVVAYSGGGTSGCPTQGQGKGH